MSYERIIDHVQLRSGLETPELAAMAVSATLSAIGRALEPDAGDRVAELLPASLVEPLRLGLSAPERGGSFLADVADHEQVNLGFAKEHASVVCEAVAGELDDARLARLRELVPDDVAALLRRHQPPPSAAPRPPHRVEAHRNLAEGRPGSGRPLADGAPSPGQTDSPAVTTDPDADTRLSSAKGPRGDDSLASGRPGSHHPVSDGETPG